MSWSRIAQLTGDTIRSVAPGRAVGVVSGLLPRHDLVARELEQEQESEYFLLSHTANPHLLGQPALTFPRQVMALMTCPSLLDAANTRKLFPADVIARAQRYLGRMEGGVGAYSDSHGDQVFRQDVKDFIEARDGHPTQLEDIWLCDGASPAIQMTIFALIRRSSDAIMTPVPGAPHYSAWISMVGGSQIGYHLDEGSGWSVDIRAIEAAYEAARYAGQNPRGLVVINPGNPTGTVLSHGNMVDIVRFAADKNLVLLADEVYQGSVLPDTPFHSFKKVAAEMGLLQSGALQLVSFHSASKGVFGEGGLRAGYAEFVGFETRVLDQLYKVASISSCPNLLGQCATALMAAPPKPGDPSYAQFEEETRAILSSLKRRAAMLVDGLNGLEGVSCASGSGATYVFPSIQLSRRAQDVTKVMPELPPDRLYTSWLFEKMGVVVAPGCAFGQRADTWHFRATVLPTEDATQLFVECLTAFHPWFCHRYQDK